MLNLGVNDELRICVRCLANGRYELLADTIRELYPNMRGLDVLELDPHSPIRHLFAGAATYVRSFYDPAAAPQERRSDGSVFEDITALSLPDASLDLIVSSDVLEHVPDVSQAMQETARVLRPGGRHLFTVPTTREKTRRRAEVVDGVTHHLLAPEYHMDPLDPAGILAYWSFGRDLPDVLARPELDIAPVAVCDRSTYRVVWSARRV